MKKCSHLQGASLVEMMVSIAVGAILSAGMIAIVVNNKSNYLSQESLSRLKENGRYARFMLQKDLRMAGFQGCNNPAVMTAKNQITSPSNAQIFLNNNVVYGYSGTTSGWSPSVPSSITRNLPPGTQIVPGTDVITVKKLSSSNVYLSNKMDSVDEPIRVNDVINFTANQTLFITDCEEINIFESSNGTNSTTIYHTSANNLSDSLSKPYTTDAYVGSFESYTYYVRTDPKTNRSGVRINVQARQDINGNEEVLIDGIDDMKINYGIDINNDGVPDTYVTASNVNGQNAWDKVVSIRISKLLNSIEEVGKTNQRYSFQGAQNTATDRMLRRQWDTYVTLRNRAL